MVATSGRRFRPNTRLTIGIVTVVSALAEVAIPQQQVDDQLEKDGGPAVDLAGPDVPEAACQARRKVDGRQERLQEHEPGEGGELLLLESDVGDRVGLAFDAFSAMLHGDEPLRMTVCVFRYAHHTEAVHLFNHKVP